MNALVHVLVLLLSALLIQGILGCIIVLTCCVCVGGVVLLYCLCDCINFVLLLGALVFYCVVQEENEMKMNSQASVMCCCLTFCY